jgi:methyl-accepting chemotaxis protein
MREGAAAAGGLLWIFAPSFGVGGLLPVASAIYAGAEAGAGLSSLVLYLALAGVATTAAHSAGLLMVARRHPLLRELSTARENDDLARRERLLSDLRALPRVALQTSIGTWAAWGVLVAVVIGLGDGVLPTRAGRLAWAGAMFAPLGMILASTWCADRSNLMAMLLGRTLRQIRESAPQPQLRPVLRHRLIVLMLALLTSSTLVAIDLGLQSLGRGSSGDGAASLPLGWATALATIGAAGALLGWRGATTLVRPMRRIIDEASRLRSGELRSAGIVPAFGELNPIAAAYCDRHERLTFLVSQLVQTGRRISEATGGFQATSQKFQATAAGQANALTETSGTSEQLAHTARQIAASATSVQELAQQTREAADVGREDAAAFQAAVERMKQDNKTIGAAVERLQRRVHQIGRIVELINTVADRSDLLALSAELEGSRAGEVGRGFSLVGGEMRRLAESVLESTSEVEELIAEIRGATIRTAEASSWGASLTDKGTSLADQVTRALSKVALLARETSNEVRAISMATQQQQTGNEQLAETMSGILNATYQGLAATRKLTATNARVIALSADLETLVKGLTATQERTPVVDAESRRQP